MVLMITAMIVVMIHVTNLPDESWMVTSRNPVIGRDEAPLGHWIVGNHNTVKQKIERGVLCNILLVCGMNFLMSILSAAINKPIMNEKPYDIAYTGEISLTGGVFAIGGTMEKIQAAYDSGCSKVFIPMQNYEHLDKEKLKEFDCEVVPVTHVSQVIKSVFPDVS